MKNYKRYFLVVFSLALIMGACTNEPNSQKQRDLDKVNLDENFKQAKKIFYNLPSPPEVSDLLFSHSTVDFNQETLNKKENIVLYESSVKQALNLGVYSTDFSFSSMSGQDQIALNYLALSKKLAQKLGIIGILGQDTVQWMAKNFNNKDSLMNVITVVYRRSEAYFNDNGKEDLALLMAIGGWTEGLYIATNLALKMDYAPSIMTKISEQRLSMDIIMQMIQSNAKEPNINKYKEDFKHMNDQYKKFSSALAKDMEAGSIISEATITEFKALSGLVRNIRSEFTN